MRQMNGFMHGVNLGGWISQFDEASEEHFGSFITEEDIRYIRSLGMDHVRVPVDYTVLEEEDGTPRESGYRYLDDCALWCRQNGLSMIIDLHKTYGYSFDPLDETDKTVFFHDASLQKRFFDLWERIAKRYQKYSGFVAYELLNEIVEPEIKEEWNRIALKAISVIRRYAPDSWIIFGGVMYNAVVSVPDLPLTDDPKVAYTFHCYEPLCFTHQGAYWVKSMPKDFRTAYPQKLEIYRSESRKVSKQLAGTIFESWLDDLGMIGPEFFERIFAPALRTSEERDIPLYCGEYGVIDLADSESKLNWARDICSVFDRHGIGRAYWNYKEKDFGIINIGDKEVQKELGRLL